MGKCPFVEECPKRVDKAFFIEVCVKAGDQKRMMFCDYYRDRVAPKKSPREWLEEVKP